MENDEITVTWGQEAYTPVSYNTFHVGPFSMTTKIQAGETQAQAFQRAYIFLESQAKIAFRRKRDQFFRNYKGESDNDSNVHT